MDFELSEEQRLLADAVIRFLDQRYDFEQRKAIVRSETGASEIVWQQLAEFGVLALPFSEASGGLGGGAVDLIGTMQALGAALVVEPVLATVLAGRLIDRVASPDARAALLGPVIAGRSRLAFAHSEDGARMATCASRAGDGWVLNGLKRVVIDAPLADRLVVSATTAAGGVSLFILIRNLSQHAHPLMPFFDSGLVFATSTMRLAMRLRRSNR